MSWLSLAAGLLRDAMSADDSSAPVREQSQVPPDVASLANYVNKLRADTEVNFQTAAGLLREQNELSFANIHQPQSRASRTSPASLTIRPDESRRVCGSARAPSAFNSAI
jgi:hypothetical protein